MTSHGVRSATATVGTPVSATSRTRSACPGSWRASASRRSRPPRRRATRSRAPAMSEGVGVGATTTSSTVGPWLEGRGRDPARSSTRCRPGSGRWCRHDRDDRRIPVDPEGQPAGRVADQRQRARGDLGLKAAVLGAADDLEARRRRTRASQTEARRCAPATRRSRWPGWSHRRTPRPGRPRSARASPGRAPHRNRSMPATAAAASCARCASSWASAPMSSASLMVTPAKPSSARNRSDITARREGRRLPRVPGEGRHRDMTRHHEVEPRRRSRPGTGRAPVARGARGRRYDGRAVVRVAAASPRPGKCLTAAATPADRRPRINAAPRTPTAAGSSPNERIPSAALSRVGRQVHDRRVDDVDAHRPGLGADRAPDPLGQRRIADGPEGHVARERASSHRPAPGAGRPPGPRRPGAAPADLHGRAAPAAWNASVSSRTCPGERTLWCRKTVIPAAGARGQPRGHPVRQPLAGNASITRPRTSEAGWATLATTLPVAHPLTAPARPRTK